MKKILSVLCGFAFFLGGCSDDSSSNPSTAQDTLYYYESGPVSNEALDNIKKCTEGDCAYYAVKQSPVTGAQISQRNGTWEEVYSAASSLNFPDIDQMKNLLDKTGAAFKYYVGNNNGYYYFYVKNPDHVSKYTPQTSNSSYYAEMGLISDEALTEASRCNTDYIASCVYTAIKNNPVNKAGYIPDMISGNHDEINNWLKSELSDANGNLLEGATKVIEDIWNKVNKNGNVLEYHPTNKWYIYVKETE